MHPLLTDLIIYVWELAFTAISAIVGVLSERPKTILKELGWENAFQLAESFGRTLHTSHLYLICLTPYGKFAFRPFSVDPWILDRAWEAKVMECLLTRLRGGVFIDIGAHIGKYSVSASSRASKVITFEPHPENYQMLLLNLGINKTQNIIAVKTAIGDRNQEINLFRGRTSGEHSIWRKSSSQIIVPSITLYSALEQLGIKTVGLVKLDVEGAEMMILQASAKIMPRVMEWIIEFHEEIHSFPKCDIENILTMHGYRTNWLDQVHIHAWREVAEESTKVRSKIPKHLKNISGPNMV
jgi:FkbM family methyltransferase